MRTIGLLAVSVVIMCLAIPASAVTLVFDPNALLDQYGTNTQASKTTQADARRFHQQWAADYYGTFDGGYIQPGHSQPSDLNAYVNWRNSLKNSGDGIAVFNVWFLDEGIARTWGEDVVVKPGSDVSATAVDGWNYTVIHDPYGLGGNVVQWYTLDRSKRLRPTDLGGANIGNFSVTADLYWDNSADGWDPSDPQVQAGQNVRFWVGNLNGDDPGFYRTDTQALYYDGAVYSDGGLNQGSGFEAALQATALPVPEPLTMLGISLGIGGLAGYIRRNRK